MFFQRTMTWSNLPPLLRIELLWAQQELACAKKLSKCLNRKKKCSIANIVDFSLVSSYIILNTMRIVNNISEQRMSRTAVVETIGLLESIYNLSFKSCFRKCMHCTQIWLFIKYFKLLKSHLIKIWRKRIIAITQILNIKLLS